MKIVYLTAGLTGIGRIVQGIAIGNALKRAKVEQQFTIVSTSVHSDIVSKSGFSHIYYKPEPIHCFSAGNYESSGLYKILIDLNPDILLIDIIWFTMHEMGAALPGKKLLLMRQLNPNFFKISIPDVQITFDPYRFDEVIECEPWGYPFTTKKLNPFVMRNRDEVLSREAACAALGLDPGEKNCLICVSGNTGEYESIISRKSSIENDGYKVFTSNGLLDGIFPAMDYYSAFDLIVGGAGYNFFWENRWLKTNAVFIPFPRKFEHQEWHITSCMNHKFKKNGADELVKLLAR